MLVQLLVIQFISFIALIFILRSLFYRQLNAALTRLNHLHEENLEKEEQLKKELEDARHMRDQELINAKNEAALIIKEAKDKAGRISVQALDQAKSDAVGVLQRAGVEAKKKENELLSSYENETIELAIQMFKYTFTQQGRDALQHSLISELIGEIDSIGGDKIIVKTKEAKVLSSYPLLKEEKEKLIKILSGKVGLKVELQEAVDSELICGLIIQMGAFVIDGSLRNKLRKAVSFIRAKT